MLEQGVVEDGAFAGDLDPTEKGHCLVTWRPQDLSADALAGIDAVIALTSPHPAGALVDITAAVADVPRTTIAALLTGEIGGAVLARINPGLR